MTAGQFDVTLGRRRDYLVRPSLGIGEVQKLLLAIADRGQSCKLPRDPLDFLFTEWYKDSAALEPGGDGNARATKVRLPWGRLEFGHFSRPGRRV